MVVLATAVSAAVSVGAIAAAAAAGGNYIVEREELKARDEEIEAEREREREEEAKMDNQKRPPKSLQHFTHNYKLAEVNSDTYSGDDCHICSQPVTRGSAYRCHGCNYIIHEVCAKDLVALSPCSYSRVKEIEPCVGQTKILTFAHRKHSVKDVYSNIYFNCHHCFSAGYGHRFRCDFCDVDIHPVCATSPTKISSFMHPQHDLELKTRKHFSFCDICNEKEKSNIRMYRCKGCKFHVHPACSQLPQHLMHNLHSMHPLILKPADSDNRCDAICGSNCLKGRWCYECKICKVSIHINCILRHALHNAHDNMEIKQLLQVLTFVSHVVQISAPIASIVIGDIHPFCKLGK